ncbi:MAG: hypothetical protein ACI9G1_003607 [Pirellulaceae bacterium]|jgi:hypothetical protein
MSKLPATICVLLIGFVLVTTSEAQVIIDCPAGSCYQAPRAVVIGSIGMDCLCSPGGPTIDQVYQPGQRINDRFDYIRRLQSIEDEMYLVRTQIDDYTVRVIEYERFNSFRDHKSYSPFLTTLQRSRYGLQASQLRLQQLDRAKQDLNREHRRQQCAAWRSGVHSAPTNVVPVPDASFVKQQQKDSRVHRLGAVYRDVVR